MKYVYFWLSLFILSSCDFKFNNSVELGGGSFVDNPELAQVPEATSSSVYLDWDVVDGAQGYILVYREGTTPPVDCKSAEGIHLIGTQYLLKNLKPETFYAFRICSVISGTVTEGQTFSVVTKEVTLQVGLLDSSFNSTGKSHTVSGVGLTGRDLTVASDGTIFVAGSYLSGSGSAAQLWAWKSDGSVETNFATNGEYFETVGSYVNGYNVIVDSNNKVVMGGYKEWSGRDDPTFWRLNFDGTPDTSFSSDGIANVGISGAEVEAFSAVEDTVNGGYFQAGGQYHNYMVISKSDSVGAAETDFGGTGTVSFSSVNRCLGRKVVVDANGKAIVAGSCSPTNNASNYDLFVWRYNADGSLDTSFDGDGYFTHSGAAGGGGDFDEEGFGLVLDSHGDIIVCGRSHNGTDYDLALWKIKASDGSLDTSFNGGQGFLTLNGSGGALGDEHGRSVVVDSTGKIIVAGTCFNSSGNKDVCVWKFNPDGTRVETFDEDGVYSVDGIAGGNGDDDGWGVALDADEKIVVSGTSNDSSTNQVFVLRLK